MLINRRIGVLLAGIVPLSLLLFVASRSIAPLSLLLFVASRSIAQEQPNTPPQSVAPTAAVSVQPVPATGTGDFTPKLSPSQAQQVVTAAQQVDAARRAKLNPTPADGLPVVQAVYMGPSKHHVSDRVGFLTFWRENGGVLIFGYPLTEEIVEKGKIVQYFERAKFEYNPLAFGAAGQVQLALLGRELTVGRDFPPVAEGTGEVFFSQTGHSLSNKFHQFWQKRGGLAVFGYPISEPFEETSTIDGQTRIVQYFERAKFEYFPEELGGFYQNRGLRLTALREVQLADLGRQAAQRQPARLDAVAAFSGAAEWSPRNYVRHIEVNLSSQSLTAYEDTVPVFSALVATGKDGFNTPTGSYAILC